LKRGIEVAEWSNKGLAIVGGFRDHPLKHCNANLLGQWSMIPKCIWEYVKTFGSIWEYT
jgi:hypothetical protein